MSCCHRDDELSKGLSRYCQLPLSRSQHATKVTGQRVNKQLLPGDGQWNKLGDLEEDDDDDEEDEDKDGEEEGFEKGWKSQWACQ